MRVSLFVCLCVRPSVSPLVLYERKQKALLTLNLDIFCGHFITIFTYILYTAVQYWNSRAQFLS